MSLKLCLLATASQVFDHVIAMLASLWLANRSPDAPCSDGQGIQVAFSARGDEGSTTQRLRDSFRAMSSTDVSVRKHSRMIEMLQTKSPRFKMTQF
jgi:hypothetical protein